MDEGVKPFVHLIKLFYPYRPVVLLLVNGFCIAGAVVLAAEVTSNLELTFLDTTLLVFVAMAVKLPALQLSKLNFQSWQYTSVLDALYILKLAIFSEIIFLGVTLPTHLGDRAPFEFYLVDMIFFIGLLTGTRLLVRALFEIEMTGKTGNSSRAKRVVIVGAGEAGIGLARKLKRGSSTEVKLIGFVDDSSEKQGIRYYGIPVLGRVDNLVSLTKSFNVDEIYIAIPSMKKADLKRITEACIASKVTFKTIPSLTEILDKSFSLDQLRDVKVEDLLGREPVELDKVKTQQEIQNEVILVTGAGGSIGSELCRQILNFQPKKLIMLERSEYHLFHIDRELRRQHQACELVPIVGDILDKQDLSAVIAEHRPALVYHAAAYKHVPLMETRPREAIKNNVIGTKILADLAIEHGVKKFVMISTDKAVRPLSVMGYSKRLAEIVIQNRASIGTTAFISVRFGNVLGSSGSVVEVFRNQLQEGGPLTVTHQDARRYFMTTPEAVELVLHAGTHGQNGAVYMLNMGEPMKIYELAEKMIQLADPEGRRGIGIEITGLRPGEKLTEELLWDGEDLVPSGIEQVSMLRTRVRIRGLDQKIAGLEAKLQCSDADMEFELKSIVKSIDHQTNFGVVGDNPSPAVARIGTRPSEANQQVQLTSI